MIRVPDDQLAEGESSDDDEARAEASEGSEQDDADEDGDLYAGLDDEDEPAAADGPSLELGEAVSIPGTGVTLRPLRGAEAVPFTTGYRLAEPPVELQVIVQQGPEEILDRIRSGALPNAPTPEAVERVRISGLDGRVGYDVVRLPQGSIERSWLLVHDGERALAVMTTYRADTAGQVRPAVQQQLRRVTWDHEVEIDASAALGVEIGPSMASPRATARARASSSSKKARPSRRSWKTPRSSCSPSRSRCRWSRWRKPAASSSSARFRWRKRTWSTKAAWRMGSSRAVSASRRSSRRAGPSLLPTGR